MKDVSTYLFITFLLVSSSSFSQTILGGGLGILNSTKKNTSSFLGGEIYVKREVTEAVRMGVSIGFYNNTEVSNGYTFRTNSIPISIGGEYLFLKDKFRPYIGMNAGLLGFTNNSPIWGNSSRFQLAITPLIGAEYTFNEQLGLNFNFKYILTFYDNTSTTSSGFPSWVSPNLGVVYHF